MNSTTVVGYATNDGDHLCCDCGDDTGEPLFCGFEVDSPAHCAECGCLIEGQSLTTDGRDYVAGKLVDADAPTPTLDACADLLADHAAEEEDEDALLCYRLRSAIHSVRSAGVAEDAIAPLVDASESLVARLLER